MKKLLAVTFLLLCVRVAFADDPSDAVIPTDDFLQQVLDFIRAFGGLSMVLKVAGIVTLIIATMKVSILNQLIWSHLGKAKVWVAPFLGFVGGLLALYAGGDKVTLAALLTYAASGGGAIYLHELLDSIKGIPGLGPAYVSGINGIEKVLGGPAAHRQTVVSTEPTITIKGFRK